MITIGRNKETQIQLENPLMLGPMAGVTDKVFRTLCREHGCGLLYTEMVSAKAVLYGNKNTESLLAISDEERPVAVQLFGSDPEIMAEIAKRMEERPFAAIDVNMGCPVPKVVGNGEGSALMKDPLLVGRLIEAMANAVKKPVTVKIRAGFNDESINAPEIAHVIEESGGAMVAVHGRTREQYYSGKADWDIIRQVKERVSIPVIGNGDVVDGPSAAALIRETGCDGVMVARAARGNPWLFEEIAEYLKTGRERKKPSVEEKCEMMLRHARMLVADKGEYIGIREMRKQFGWYTFGIHGASKLRNDVNQCETYEELAGLVEKIMNDYRNAVVRGLVSH